MRARLLVSLTILIALTGQAGADDTTPITTKQQLDEALGTLYGKQTIDESAARKIQNKTFKSDIATFTLRNGTLYPAAPLNGRVTAAVFIGDGAVTIQPVRAMDRECLDLAMKRHLNVTPGGKLDETFSALFLLGVDETIPSLLSAEPAPPGEGIEQARRIISERLGVLSTEEYPLDIQYAQHLAGIESPFLVADFKTPSKGWLTYVHNSRLQNETILVTWEKVGRFDSAWLLLNTHKASDFDPNGRLIVDSVKDQKSIIDITQYKLEIEIPDTKHLLVEADVIFRPLEDSLKLVDFDLVNNIAGIRSTDAAKPIHLRKVTLNGVEMPFAHVKNRAVVVPPEPLRNGKDYTFRFSLDEETIRQLSTVHYLMLNTYPWYPQHGYLGGLAKMDWTVKAKKPLQATGSGRIVREAPEGIYNVTQLVFDKDVGFPSLIFGQYKKATDRYTPAGGGRGVDLSTYYWPRATFYIMDLAANADDLKLDDRDDNNDPNNRRLGVPLSLDVNVPGGKPKGILEEAKEIIKFLEGLYGPFPYDQVQIAQMSLFLDLGQAPPGFVQLTGEAFMSSAELESDFFHAFFGHEMAHQYWGHALQWSSDEDQWLSESFAEHTAGLYVLALQGKTRFEGKLKEWRDAARTGDPQAPIAWANNLGGPNAGKWRNDLIYYKGPYVVHMLYSQLGHDVYMKAMQALIQKYRFQQITTDQMAQELSKAAGYDLNYFFDQWFRGTGIPTIDYSYVVTQTDDDKFLATVKMSQRDKAKFKVMQVPVFFHFGKDQMVVKNRPMLQAEDTYTIKLPSKPVRITVDDNRTLLADIVGQGDAAGH